MSVTRTMKHPNILYIHSHDTGRYIQPYGHAVPTPTLQTLAEQGVLFRQAFSMAPTCSPSRAALLTGQCPHSSGMLGLAHRGGFRLNDYRRHILHTLRQAGYYSALFGVQHIAMDPNVIGYDKFCTRFPRGAPQIAAAAAEFLNGEPKRPFFLSVGFFETHRIAPVGGLTEDTPHCLFHPPGPAEDPRYCSVPDGLPDTPEVREDFASFKASARILDQNIKTVLDALEANGLADDTLVIYTTDHGIAFPGMKCNLTDGGIAISLIIRGPGDFQGGRVCDAMISHCDLFGTLCELVQIDPPNWLEGKSFMPIIRNEANEINEEIFAEVTYHAAYEPQRAVRTRRWKYIRRYGDRTKPVLPNCDDSPSRDLWIRYGMKDRNPARDQLYDLIFDPTERCNLADDPSSAGVLDEMRRRLDQWMQRTNDPLLQGPVPAPPGTTINDPDSVSFRQPTITIP